jgi:hypothetical protein
MRAISAATTELNIRSELHLERYFLSGIVFPSDNISEMSQCGNLFFLLLLFR